MPIFSAPISTSPSQTVSRSVGELGSTFMDESSDALCSASEDDEREAVPGDDGSDTAVTVVIIELCERVPLRRTLFLSVLVYSGLIPLSPLKNRRSRSRTSVW